jgi:ArsR family transcriptional regulator
MEKNAQIFQSLSEEVRLRILALLLSGDELCVCDLMAALQLPQSTVSRHLAHLKNADWLRDRREAVWSYYALARPLPPLQQSLLPLLGHFLREEPLARADRERLTAFRRDKVCA